MKYACLVYAEEATFEAMTTDESVKLTDSAIDYDATLRERGQLIYAQALQPTTKAVTIRVRNGKASMTDGPFAETREHLAGFMLIEARDLNEAIEIVSAAPMARVASMEVRPFLDLSHS